MKAVIRFILIVLCMFTSVTNALDQTETGFFYPIGAANFDQRCGTWLGRDTLNGGCYFPGFYHIGVDMMREQGTDVYAVADGKVVGISRDDGSGNVWGIGNCALVVEHKTYDGLVFTAVYGHLQCGTIPALKSDVYGGKPVGKIGYWEHGNHLHFSIHDGSYSSMAKSSWGRMSNSSWSSTNTFTDPIAFIQTHYAYNPSTERQTPCFMDICWEPKSATCETAISRYKLLNPPYAQRVGAEVCDELRSKMAYITGAPNLQERVPEDQPSRNWLRWVFEVLGLGLIVDAAELEQVKYEFPINTINVYTGTVVAGNASRAVHGAGAGYLVAATDEAIPSLPDFVVNKTWLVTPWGIETYKFGLNESFDTKAQSENIGDGPCLNTDTVQTITGHFYLSKGYKEDVHSGDGAWRRIDSTTTQCDNLKPGDTHTETKNTVIREWITTPGIYNIVYCIDHPQDDHNNGGDHREKHESNNCSTEAVFEVTANPIENQDPRFVDFVTSDLRFQQAPYYAGDQARFGTTVTNQGNTGSPADIRSSYSVQCPGTSLIYLADDGTMASTLSAGASAFEENIGPVTLPNVAGTCTAYFCADYQGAVAESDETNNCTSLLFTLQPRPKPKLVITKFQDEVGCCTTNRGSRIKPDIWVRNDGPVAPASDVTVLYHISSPVATGGAWWNIGYGVIRPSELPSGGTDEDYMEGNGWPIPSGSAWKLQWHTVRACLKQDGSTPVGDPNTEVCAYYTRYSKK